MGGSISPGTTMMKMKDLKQRPTIMEVYLKVHQSYDEKWVEPRAEMIWNEAKAIREVQEILNYDGTPIPISELTDAKVLALALGSWSKKGRICGLSFLNELPFSGFRGQDIAGSSRGFEDEINTMRQRVDELNQAIRARVEFERSQRANRERELRREFKEELRDLKRSHKSAKMMIAWKSIMSAQQKMFEKLSWIIVLNKMSLIRTRAHVQPKNLSQ
ncbi:uncharacterized protein LOC116204620 isoform X1 [Punica granatum]|uniref:Uncharacterized protein LOC116204620 isoform X1 n=1 Tax=Punica granatum TaxID=22663 RepID=A0A6P8DHA1_PUNGR|nr:uncharacterized protein LOC116204620 isoform X1 [Punica granatum]